MRRLWVIGLAALAVSGISGVAAAKPLDKGTFHDESSEVVEDFCDVGGLTAEVDNVFDVRFSANTKGNDQLVYFAQHIDISNVYTDVDTGAFVTESIRFVDKDLKVTDNGDGTLSVLILSTGNAYDLRRGRQGDRAQPWPGAFPAGGRSRRHASRSV